MPNRSRRKRKISAVSLSGLVAAAGVFAYGVSLTPPSLLVHDVYRAMAASSVSVSAGVPANPDNTLAEQLNEKAAQLDVQQQHIQQLEQSLSNSPSDRLSLLSLVASCLLFLLVAANFYFDWRRSRGVGGVLTKPLSVDLRAGTGR